MFVKQAWYVACWADDLANAGIARRICDEPIFLFRDQEDKVAALRDVCPHRSAPLSLGRIVEGGLECGYHGMVFNSAGVCIRIPGQDQIPPTARVKSFPVVEQDGLIWVWMGDPAKAETGEIVSYPYHTGPRKWPHRTETYHVRANYLLLVDNLMDLTHLAYVHRSTIGGADPTSHVEAQMDLEKTQQGLRFTRWLLDSPAPPTYLAAVPELSARIDRWMNFEFIAPATVVQWAGGVTRKGGTFDPCHRDGGFSLRIFHGLTPETESTSFYFWSAANGYRQDDATATDQLHQQISTAFNEDKVVLERQQERLREFGEAGLIAMKSDGARLHMRRIMRRLLARESSSNMATSATPSHPS